MVELDVPVDTSTTLRVTPMTGQLAVDRWLLRLLEPLRREVPFRWLRR